MFDDQLPEVALKLGLLEALVRAHSGQFHCERIRHSDEKKVVNFRHKASMPTPHKPLPEIGRLGDFYDTFGSVILYVDEESGDAARQIAGPHAWSELYSQFNDWFDSSSGEELEELAPKWIKQCLAIGEVPRTGNYLLMPVSGDVAGHVFLFDHDGFEFTDCADDLVEFVEKMLAPNDELLLDMATHMRFIDGDDSIQWWIRELRDNRGNVARTYV